MRHKHRLPLCVPVAWRTGSVDFATWAAGLQAAALTDGPAPIQYALIDIASLFSSAYPNLWPANMLSSLDSLSAVFEVRRVAMLCAACSSAHLACAAA